MAVKKEEKEQRRPSVKIDPAPPQTVDPVAPTSAGGRRSKTEMLERRISKPEIEPGKAGKTTGSAAAGAAGPGTGTGSAVAGPGAGSKKLSVEGVAGAKKSKKKFARHKIRSESPDNLIVEMDDPAETQVIDGSHCFILDLIPVLLI